MSHRSMWDRPQRAEVMPPSYSLAAVVAMGIFALSIAGGGLLFGLVFGRRKKRELDKIR